MKSIWNLLTSLKLAIVLASMATIVMIAGSLVMHYHPEIFGVLDRVTLGDWYPRVADKAPWLTAWMPLAGILIIALGINTFCCFCEWLVRLRGRWRKLGEYLIHLGFVLLVVAFFWGNQAGFRTDGNQLFIGETVQLEQKPGFALRLDEFEPVFPEGSRRPMDMINQLTLLKNGSEVARAEVRINSPLLYEGLVVLPASFGSAATGFNVFISGQGRVLLERGTELSLGKDRLLEVIDFLPNATRIGNRIVNRGDNLIQPAFHMKLSRNGSTLWQGWYFLRRGLPPKLQQQGIELRPLAPLNRTYSLLTINYDPAIRLAAWGGGFMTAGVGLAFFSYYFKRRRKDRPEVV